MRVGAFDSHTWVSISSPLTKCCLSITVDELFSWLPKHFGASDGRQNRLIKTNSTVVTFTEYLRYTEDKQTTKLPHLDNDSIVSANACDTAKLLRLAYKQGIQKKTTGWCGCARRYVSYSETVRRRRIHLLSRTIVFSKTGNYFGNRLSGYREIAKATSTSYRDVQRMGSSSSRKYL